MGADASQSSQKQGVRLRAIALPAEHGGWGFVLEPLLLGHLVASSAAGWWLVLIALGTFLMHQPLKIAFIDLRRGKRYARTHTALWIVLIYGLVALIGLAGVLITADAVVLLPLIVAVPFMALQLAYDTRRDSRALLPELAGAGALGGYATAIALAGGWAVPTTLALWIIIIARVIPSILYVRTRLLLEKGKPANRVLPIIAHSIVVVIFIILALMKYVPVLVLVASVVLLLRAAHGLSRFRRPSKAITIGFFEIAFGLIVVVLAAVGFQFNL